MEAIWGERLTWAEGQVRLAQSKGWEKIAVFCGENQLRYVQIYGKFYILGLRSDLLIGLM